jgi:hypothetical protein
MLASNLLPKFGDFSFGAEPVSKEEEVDAVDE